MLYSLFFFFFFSVSGIRDGLDKWIWELWSQGTGITYSLRIWILKIFFFFKLVFSTDWKLSGGSGEKAMTPHSSTLAWKIPWAEEPGSLQSMGSQRVGHDWATSLSLFTFLHWRRKWQPTPVFLPGEPQGQGSLIGCRLWGRTESDATEATAAAAGGWGKLQLALCT